jgi:uncharacterized protein (UPF0179 family)
MTGELRFLGWWVLKDYGHMLENRKVMKGENTTKNTEMCDFSDCDMNWFLHTVNMYKVDVTIIINVGGGGSEN